MFVLKRQCIGLLVLRLTHQQVQVYNFYFPYPRFKMTKIAISIKDRNMQMVRIYNQLSISTLKVWYKFAQFYTYLESRHLFCIPSSFILIRRPIVSLIVASEILSLNFRFWKFWVYFSFQCLKWLHDWLTSEKSWKTLRSQFRLKKKIYTLF